MVANGIFGGFYWSLNPCSKACTLKFQLNMLVLLVYLQKQPQYPWANAAAQNYWSTKFEKIQKVPFKNRDYRDAANLDQKSKIILKEVKGYIFIK